MAKPRRRTESQEFLLYDSQSDNVRGWSVTRRIGYKAGEQMELAGRAERVHDEMTGQHVGWRVCEERPVSDGMEISSDPTLALMSVYEMELVSGVRGKSRTAGMDLNDSRRLMRVTLTGKPLPAEDAVERARAKLAEVGSTPRPGADALTQKLATGVAPKLAKAQLKFAARTMIRHPQGVALHA